VILKKILKVIDSISEYSGRIFSWACVALILILSYETMMRYVFDAPTVWAHLVGVMLGGTIIFMGWGYVHLHQGHLRIDVIYVKLSPTKRAVIDVVFCLLFLFPLLYVMLDTSISWAVKSWVTGEVRIESWWYPPAAPFRTIMVVGIFIFVLQAFAQFFRDAYLLIRKKPYD